MTLWVTDSLDVNPVGYNAYYNWDCELLTSNNGHFYWPYQHYDIPCKRHNQGLQMNFSCL